MSECGPHQYTCPLHVYMLNGLVIGIVIFYMMILCPHVPVNWCSKAEYIGEDFLVIDDISPVCRRYGYNVTGIQMSCICTAYVTWYHSALSQAQKWPIALAPVLASLMFCSCFAPVFACASFLFCSFFCKDIFAFLRIFCTKYLIFFYRILWI